MYQALFRLKIMEGVIRISTQLLNNKLYIIVLASSLVIFCVVVILTFTGFRPRYVGGEITFEEESSLDVSDSDYVHEEETTEEMTEEEYDLNDSIPETNPDETIEPSL